MRSAGCTSDFSTRTVAWIREPQRIEAGERGLVDRGPRRLKARALVPREPEPSEVLEDALGRPLHDARSVDVLHAKHCPSRGSGGMRQRPRGKRRPGSAEMK